MKPLKDEEAAGGISRKQSQNAVYQTCATLAGGESLAAAKAAPTGVTADERGTVEGYWVTQGGCGVRGGNSPSRVGKGIET